MPLAVYIRSADPLTTAGVAFHLQREGPVILVSADAVDEDTVVVAVCERIDDQTTRELVSAARLGARALVLVIDELDRLALARAIGIGVRGIVRRRDARGEDVRAAVAAVADGHAWLPPELLGDLLQMLRRTPLLPPGTVAPPVSLSEREADVLRLLADGFGTGEIAQQLAYSERTIKAVLHGVTERLHLRNRTHAVAYLVRHGFL